MDEVPSDEGVDDPVCTHSHHGFINDSCQRDRHVVMHRNGVVAPEEYRPRGCQVAPVSIFEHMRRHQLIHNKARACARAHILEARQNGLLEHVLLADRRRAAVLLDVHDLQTWVVVLRQQVRAAALQDAHLSAFCDRLLQRLDGVIQLRLGHQHAGQVGCVRVDNNEDEESVRHGDEPAPKGDRSVRGQSAPEGGEREPHAFVQRAAHKARGVVKVGGSLPHRALCLHQPDCAGHEDDGE
mmetsp:Transcript_44006/g.112383  ORF Transcript_44006/g.112383 Transcript_44006/m.112383 type:complete len:240 (-) Transcript_44006:134-853(-)